MRQRGIKTRPINVLISVALHRRIFEVRKLTRFNASEICERALRAAVEKLEREMSSTNKDKEESHG